MVEAPAKSPARGVQDPAFWDWSLAHYQRRGVESLLLRLQDKMGLSVNMLLWTMWCAERFETVPELCVRKAIDAVAFWESHVATPLRNVRRDLKHHGDIGGAEELRTQVKAAELAAEKIEQTILEKTALTTLTPTASRAPEAVQRRARQNLTTYAALVSAPQREGFSTSLLQSLIDRIFGGAPRSGLNSRAQQA